MNIIRRFLSVEHMVKPEHLRGELVGSREAYRNLLKIAVPSIVEMVCVALVGSVDVVMVGRLGFEAIAAVGLASQPRFILMTIFLALNVGVTAIVARRKGEELPDKAKLAVRNALVLGLGLTILIMTLALVFSRQIMIIAGAQPDTIDMADDYFRIMLYFMPVNAVTMCINAAQRGVGNTRITMIANIAANIVNVFFDYALIYGNWGFPKLGVAGDAWASGVGFIVALVITLIAAFSGKGDNAFIRISFKDSWRLHKETVMSIVKIGGNSAFEQIAQRVGIFIYAIIIANLGTAVFSAHQVCMQFLSLSFNFGNGLAAAAISLVGQMLGRERADLAIIYGKCAQRLALLIGVALAGSIVLFRGPLIGIFLDTRDAANAISISIAVDIMLVVAMIQPPQTSAVVYAGCLRAAGDNLYVAYTMLICVAIARPILCSLAVFVFGFGAVGAWSATFCDMCIRLFLVQRRFSGSKWHNIKV